MRAPRDARGRYCRPPECVDGAADLLLGQLVELLVDAGAGLELHRPRNRWLAWDVRDRRLWSVRRGRRLGDAPDADRERVAGFHWSPELEAELWQTWRPQGRISPAGELAAVVYLARKGGEVAEWEHWFHDRPRAGRTPGGEWVFDGRVAVSDRGIES